jgi:nucleoside-diphosphate-sugar epimerase
MDLLHRLQRAAPPGQEMLADRTIEHLKALTAELLGTRPGAVDEHGRFAAIRDRTIAPPPHRVGAAVTGRTILVTGGSGCVGHAVLAALTRLRPARLISLADIAPTQRVAGVEYLHGDVRDEPMLGRLFARRRPEVVFHLAAQRDPGRAEREPAAALGTNVLGTRNLLAVAERTGVGRLVYASTGKAMRPYTPDVYAGSKRLGEWLAADTAARGTMACSGVRFTHVVDNSIIMRRLQTWCARGSVVRLHALDTMFYVQSALESAQLLLTALTAPADDVFRLHLIRDLGWPISLLDLALGTMAAHRTVAPIYLAGPEPGYERAAYPGLYDPRYAGELSPLINAIEAPVAVPSPCPEVDVVPMPRPFPGWLPDGLDALERACRDGDDDAARHRHDELGRQVLAAVAETAPPATLQRVTKLTAPHRPSMPAEHRLIDDAFRAALAMPAGRLPDRFLAGAVAAR